MKMIDITNKEITEREAVVEGIVYIKAGIIKLIKEKKIPKGDVLEAAKLAGILAAKQTPFIIPLCHPISLEYAQINFITAEDKITITTTVRGRARTGVEMEAFTATSVAALTIYDMCKAMDRDIVISDIKLLKKTGGKSGTYVRKI